ncbi:MAG: DinB family protein [Bryobacteraceae bacterium]
MKKTMLFVYACAALVAVSAAAFAQEPANPNPLSGGEKGFYMMVSGSLIAGAEKMPEENYSFKPTPDVRSFGQLVGHAANAQYMFCSMAAGEKNPNTVNIEQTVTSKAGLVQALKDGVAYCNKVYGAMTDAQASQVVKMFGRDLAKLTVLTVNTAHADEHYGNMVTYLRLKGIVPPTSEPKK